MSRYIDIEPYEKDGWYLQKTYCDTYGAGVKTTPLKSVPTAEPNNGRWVKLFTGNYKCSECGSWWGSDYNDEIINDFNYCPNCGAKMDKAERMTREEAIEILSDMRCECNLFGDEEEATRYHALSWAINAMNTEPKHGRWIDKDGNFECSHCGNLELLMSLYCRRCGARMDGGEDDTQNNNFNSSSLPYQRR